MINARTTALTTARTTLNSSKGKSYDIDGLSDGYDVVRGFRHPGGLHTKADFDRIKQQLKDGNTKVTINEIVLESEKQLKAAGLEAIKENSTFEYNDDYVEPLSNQGIFNLVTGIWSNTAHEAYASYSTERTQTSIICSFTFPSRTSSAR